MRRLLVMVLALTAPAFAQAPPAPVAPVTSPGPALTPAQALRAQHEAEKRQQAIARRTAEIERVLRPIVEKWYGDREPADYRCPHHVAPDCPNCVGGGMSKAAGAAAWTDLMSPAGLRLMHEPPPAGEPTLFERILKKQVMADQVGQEFLLTRAVWLGVRLEDRVVIARAHVTWYVGNGPESDHESRWVLVRGRFYLAADGELGDALLPPERR